MKAQKCPTISDFSLVGKKAKKIIFELPLWMAYAKIVTSESKEDPQIFEHFPRLGVFHTAARSNIKNVKYSYVKNK